MTRRLVLLAWAVAASVAVVGAGCDDGRARPLVLVDGSGPGAAAWVDERARAFEKQSGRAVRVLRVDGAESALSLAARGEAEVALVPSASSIDELVRNEQGRDAGTVARPGGAVRVVEVNQARLPKVDGAGAKTLAAFLVAP